MLNVKKLLTKILSHTIAPLKICIVENETFVFSNQPNSATKSLSSVTGGVVTSANIVAGFTSGNSTAFVFGLDSSGNVFLRWGANITGSYNVNLIIFYK